MVSVMVPCKLMFHITTQKYQGPFEHNEHAISLPSVREKIITKINNKKKNESKLKRSKNTPCH